MSLVNVLWQSLLVKLMHYLDEQEVIAHFTPGMFKDDVLQCFTRARERGNRESC